MLSTTGLQSGKLESVVHSTWAKIGMRQARGRRDHGLVVAGTGRGGGGEQDGKGGDRGGAGVVSRATVGIGSDTQSRSQNNISSIRIIISSTRTSPNSALAALVV